MWPGLVVIAIVGAAYYLLTRVPSLAEHGIVPVLGKNPTAAARVRGGELVGIAIRRAVPGGFTAVPAHVLEAGPKDLVVEFDSDNLELEPTPPELAGQRLSVPRAAVAWVVAA